MFPTLSLVLLIQVITLILLFLSWKALSPFAKNFIYKYKRGVWYILWPIIFGFWSLFLQSYLFAALIASTSELIIRGILYLKVQKVKI